MKIFRRIIINTAVVYLCLYGYFDGPLNTIPFIIEPGPLDLNMYLFFYVFPSILTLLALRGVRKGLNHRTKEPISPRAGLLAAFLGVFFFLVSFLSFYQMLIDKEQYLHYLGSSSKIEVAIILLIFIPFFAVIFGGYGALQKKEMVKRNWTVTGVLLRVIINTAVVCLCIHGYYDGAFGGVGYFVMAVGNFAFLFFPSLLTALALLGVSRVCNLRQFLPPRAEALAALVGVLLFFPCLETFLKVEDTGFLSGISAVLEMVSAALAFDVILLYILIRRNSRYVGRASGEEGQESVIMGNQEIFRTGFNIVAITGVIQLYYYNIRRWIDYPAYASLEYWFWGVLLPCSLALIVPLLLPFALRISRYLRGKRGEEGKEEGTGKESFIMSKQEIFRTGFNIVAITGVIQLYYYTIQWWIEPPVYDSVEYWFWGVLLPCSLVLIVLLLLHFALCFIKSLRVSTENAVKLALWALPFLNFSAILFIDFCGFSSDPGWMKAEFVDNEFSGMTLEAIVTFFALSILAVCWLSVVSYLDWKSGDQQ